MLRHSRTILAAIVVSLMVLGMMLTACREDRLTFDTTAGLTFSRDSISFDTVFTGFGTATKRLMLYNRNDNAVRIDRVWMEQGDNSFFHINIDGENDLNRMGGMEVRGGDSLFVFVRVSVDIQQKDNPVLIEDKLHVLVNGSTATLPLTAIGQDVVLLRSATHRKDTTDMVMTSAKPYLIYDTLSVGGTLTLQAGARVYMHAHGVLHVTGDLYADGTQAAPVRIMGDRIDRLFDSVPYAYAAGGWNGIYLVPTDATPHTYRLNYTEITSGTNALVIEGQGAEGSMTPVHQLSMHNCRIHNHAGVGLWLEQVSDSIVNSEISNCAAYCVYTGGGEHVLMHTTVASYFNATTIRIQSTQRMDVPAVYINDRDSIYGKNSTSLINCLVAGVRSSNLALVTADTLGYTGSFVGNYLKADSLPVPPATADANIYWTKDEERPLFRQSFYRYKEYKYYDFSLDSVSPARGIADSLSALAYPTDRRGITRTPYPDAGCYQYQP